MAFQTALTRLAALSVAGVAHNYAVEALPGSLSRAQLPALLVLPGRVEREGVAAGPGEGFQAIAFSGGARTVAYRVTHLLLAAPMSAGAGARTHLPAVVALIDAYFSALAADLTLNAALLEPAAVQVEPGLYAYGGVRYFGCAFEHRWLIEV